jgi:D-alanine-D-alanine ligase
MRGFGRIGVLMGGPSTEREISLKSGKAVCEALKQAGIDAVAIDVKTDDAAENIALIESSNIDCAFLALHGRFGEDGQIQNILESLKMPYTGSGVEASRLAMDKIASRKIFEAHHLCVPSYRVFVQGNDATGWRGEDGFSLPLVVKPATHGSSLGLSIVDDKTGIDQAVDLAFGYDERILVEEYIKGREVTVGILEDSALPVIEIVPKKRFFDYEAKYQSGMTEYIAPAQLNETVARKIQEAALSAHRLLGCFGCSRVDIILRDDATPFILEVNTIPGFTATSLLPKAARIVGIEFGELCIRLITLAYAKA